MNKLLNWATKFFTFQCQIETNEKETVLCWCFFFEGLVWWVVMMMMSLMWNLCKTKFLCGIFAERDRLFGLVVLSGRLVQCWILEARYCPRIIYFYFKKYF